ncbi:MAG: NUDIX hydrolase [Nanoarchaeota archaeon]
MKTNVRVSAILFYHGRLVVVKHASAKFGDYYLLPGGGWEHGETLEQCAIREVKEETGLDVSADYLAFYKTVYTDEDDTLDLVFVCSYKEGNIQNKDPDKKVVSIELISSELNLEKLNFHPKQLKSLVFRLPQDKKAYSLGSAKYPES